MKSNSSITHSLVHDFYVNHSAWLFAWLARKIGSKPDAADLTQDTFMRILLKADLDSILEPRAYLTSIATHLMIDHVRRRKLEQAYLEALAAQQIETHACSPEEHHAAIETLLAISKMLDGLPEKARRAFLMSRLENACHADIAAVLGVSVSMVKQYIARALLHCYQVVYGVPGMEK